MERPTGVAPVLQRWQRCVLLHGPWPHDCLPTDQTGGRRTALRPPPGPPSRGAPSSHLNARRPPVRPAGRAQDSARPGGRAPSLRMVRAAGFAPATSGAPCRRAPKRTPPVKCRRTGHTMVGDPGLEPGLPRSERGVLTIAPVPSGARRRSRTCSYWLIRPAPQPSGSTRVKQVAGQQGLEPCSRG